MPWLPSLLLKVSGLGGLPDRGRRQPEPPFLIMKRILIFLLLIFISSQSYAVHYRMGSIVKSTPLDACDGSYNSPNFTIHPLSSNPTYHWQCIRYGITNIGTVYEQCSNNNNTYGDPTICTECDPATGNGCGSEYEPPNPCEDLVSQTTNHSGSGLESPANICSQQCNAVKQTSSSSLGQGWWGTYYYDGTDCTDGGGPVNEPDPEYENCHAMTESGHFICDNPLSINNLPAEIPDDDCAGIAGITICSSDPKNCGEFNGQYICAEPIETSEFCLEKDGKRVCGSDNVKQIEQSTTIQNPDGSTVTVTTNTTNVKNSVTTNTTQTTSPDGSQVTTETTSTDPEQMAGLKFTAPETGTFETTVTSDVQSLKDDISAKFNEIKGDLSGMMSLSAAGSSELPCYDFSFGSQSTQLCLSDAEEFFNMLAIAVLFMATIMSVFIVLGGSKI